MIRDQLVPGRAEPEEVEALTARAAIVVRAARAALRRATTRLELLEQTAGIATAAPGQTKLPAEHPEPSAQTAPRAGFDTLTG